jgi:hypothetical protein
LWPKTPSQTLRAKAEQPFMLPGFRFLFAAVVLSTSMLIFGLGAAALLRAAHEEFASIPSRRAPPEIMFTQQSEARPSLAMMRAEPAAAELKDAGSPTGDVQIASPGKQSPIASTAPEPENPATELDKVAALTDIATPAENSSPSENPKPEPSTSEIAVQAEAPSPAAETTVAAIAEITNQVAATVPDQTAPPVEESTRIAETRIATLGGPPVSIETNTASKVAPAAVKKNVQAKRIVKRRKIAQRPRTTQQASQRPVDPFGQPLGR